MYYVRNFTVKNLEDTTLAKFPELTSPVLYHVPPDIRNRERHFASGILFLNIWPQSNLEKTPDKAKLRDMAQNK